MHNLFDVCARGYDGWMAGNYIQGQLFKASTVAMNIK